MTHERFYPSEETLGKDCRFWDGIENPPIHKLATRAIGCTFAKEELRGRLSCEGIVDDVCLYLMIGRRPPSLTQEQIDEIRFRVKDGNNRYLPPGDIT